MYLLIIFIILIILIIFIFYKCIESFDNSDIPIFVINIKRNNNRWLVIKKQASLYNFKINKYLGIDGRNHKFTDIEKNLFNNPYFIENNKNLGINGHKKTYKDVLKNFFNGDTNTLRTNPSKFTKLSEKGCALSHYYLWKKIVDKKISKCIVCEDDVRFKKKFNNYIQNLDTHNYDIIYLYYSKKTINKFPKKKITKLNNKIWISAGNVCYLITYQGAKKLTNIIENKGIYLPIDWLILDNISYLNIGLIDNIYIFLNNTFKSSID